MLGAWLAFSPFVFGSFESTGFSDAVMRVTAARGLPDPALRSAMLGYSDVVSGLLVMLFGALSLSPRFAWAQWANAVTGARPEERRVGKECVSRCRLRGWR